MTDHPFYFLDNISEMFLVACVTMPCSANLWVRGTVFMDGIVGVLPQYRILNAAISFGYTLIWMVQFAVFWFPLSMKCVVVAAVGPEGGTPARGLIYTYTYIYIYMYRIIHVYV